MPKLLKVTLWLVPLACLLVVATYLLRHHLPLPVAERLGLRADITAIRAKQIPALTASLAEKGLFLGAPVYIRIFKEEAELEVWVQDQDSFRLFHSFPICNHSGNLGPKLKEGDRQSPEGFYAVDHAALNPASRFHLSFNLGFPNAYDRGHGRTGSFLMVHGNCVSVGCYAMTDAGIEAIYILVEQALQAGQPAVPVHAFPFRMTPERMAAAGQHQWIGFWKELQPAYQSFEATRQVPQMVVIIGAYRPATP